MIILSQQQMENAKEATKVKELSLAEIRQSLADIEAQRVKATDLEQRIALEEAAITLRQAERKAVKSTQKDLVKEFKTTAQDVNLQAKKIRSTVTKLNKVDKALDGMQNVIKECIRILKIIASMVSMLFVLVMISSCVMTKSQLKTVNSLAIGSDSVATAPSAIFSKLADVRKERGLIYIASLEGTETRISELDNLYNAIQSDKEIINQTNAYVNILNSYISTLKSLSATTRYEQYGTSLRGVGRNVDSLFIAYNSLETSLDHKDRLIEKEHIGIAKQVGKTSGYLASETGRRVQRRLMKKFLEQGDTLVSTCCDRLAEIVKKEQVSELINLEEQGITADYRSYLNSMHAQGTPINANFDAEYLSMRQDIADARKIQSQCVSALNSLKKAHHKLLGQMKKGATYQEYAESLSELSSQTTALRKILK